MESDPQKDIPFEILRWKKRLEHLRTSDLAYLESLYEQFRDPAGKPDLKIGVNFYPSAMLKAEERRALLGLTEYTDLHKDRARHERFARNVILILNPMNGGIGTTLERETYLRRIWKSLGRKGAVVLGAKGSDLYFDVRFDGRRAKVSVSEAKILRALKESPRYSRIVLEELASSETITSVNSLLDSVNVYGRAGVSTGWKKKSYRGILNGNRKTSCAETLIQAAIPTVDEEGNLTDARVAPGGHGQWGVYLLLRALESRSPGRGKTAIAAIYNEDGINNTIDPVIAGWMAVERIPMAMITTTKTHIDKKGGQIGIFRAADGSVRKEIFEEAQAISCGQEELFLEMGLTEGEKDAQYFNTNTAVLNYSVLTPFLKDLKRAIGMERFREVISPVLIQNRKTQVENGAVRTYTQLEGALGSSLINLDGYLSTAKESRVREILKLHRFLDPDGNVRFLRILNIGARDRTRFFTPVKNAFDFWLQFHSDLFKINTRTWELELLRPGTMPSVTLSDHYKDLTIVLEAFGEKEGSAGSALVKDLDRLEVNGNVRFPGAVLRGRVRIDNLSDRVIDLTERRTRGELIPMEGKKLVLQDVRIRIDASGEVRVSSFGND